MANNLIGIDLAVSSLAIHLLNKLPWLLDAYPIAQRIKRKNLEGRDYYIHAVKMGGGEYLSMSPSVEGFNYSYCLLNDPQKIHPENGRLSGTLSVVFYVDLRNLGYDDNTSTSHLQAVIFEALKTVQFNSGSLRVVECVQEFTNVFKGVSLNETDDQLLMYPFKAFRFECEYRNIQITAPCQQ